MNFYVLRGGYCDDDKEFELYIDEVPDVEDAPQCPTCGGTVGMIPYADPVVGVLQAGRKCYDLTKQLGGDVMLSERCRETFEREGLSGMNCFQRVKIRRVKGPMRARGCGEYLLARVSFGAKVDRVRSVLRTSTGVQCPDCGYAGIIEGYDRVAVDVDSWSGQDFFKLHGLPGPIMVSERAKQVCDRYGLSICKLIPAEEYGNSYYPKFGS
ncbi:MAG: hypothetical protein JNM66_21865 [Bryobacterales bacterium]|nr:hypothetical protein [Bryobacterales bacterium]